MSSYVERDGSVIVREGQESHQAAHLASRRDLSSCESSVRRKNDLIMSRLIPLLWDGILPSSRDTSRMEVDQEEVGGSKEDDETSRLEGGEERDKSQSRRNESKRGRTRTHVVLSEDVSEDTRSPTSSFLRPHHLLIESTKL